VDVFEQVQCFPYSRNTI